MTAALARTDRAAAAAASRHAPPAPRKATPEAGAEAQAEAKAAALNAELRGADALDILERSIADAFAGRITYVSSFGSESVAMLSLIAEVDPSLPIVFLQTGMHFPQTLAHKDEVIERLGLSDVRDIVPDEEERLAEDPKGTLWRTDPDNCCALRKVRPLEPALKGFDAWITGRKRFHGGLRARMPVFEAAGARIKVNPLAEWTPEDVAARIEALDLPRHKLVAEGYPSIGCWPCTRPSSDPEDFRSGRWAGRDKEECGLHVDAGERPQVF